MPAVASAVPQALPNHPSHLLKAGGMTPVDDLQVDHLVLPAAKQRPAQVDQRQLLMLYLAASHILC